MSLAALRRHVEYVTDAKGKRKVLVDVAIWEELLVLLDDEERLDSELTNSALLMQRLEEARANYESGDGGDYEQLRQILLSKGE